MAKAKVSGSAKKNIVTSTEVTETKSGKSRVETPDNGVKVTGKNAKNTFSAETEVVSVKKDAPLELYHISKDMTESTNLAQDHPEIVKEFEQEMNKMRTPSPNWPLPNE